MSNEKAPKLKKPFYKRVWVWIIAIVVVSVIATSGNDDSAEDKITDEEPSSTETASETTTTDTEATEETTEEAEPVKEAEPTQLYTDDRVTIYFKSMGTEGVRFLVENKTSKSVTIQADSIAINGFSTNDMAMSADISPNSKGYADALTTSLADAGTPEKISASLNIIDSDSFETLANAQFTDVPLN
jgi:hypothetical protein